MFKKFIALLFAASAVLCSTTAGAQAPVSSPYASEACKTGCVYFESNSIVYSGTLVRTYRVCADNFRINVIVDGRQVPVAAKFCADVSGQAIRVDGNAFAGLLPN